MKLFLGLILATVLVLIVSESMAQQLFQDVIILKSGKEVRGVIQEKVDGEYVKIRSRDNRTLEIPFADIERITQEVFEAEGLKKDLLDPYFMKNKHDYWSLATGIGPSYGGFGLRFQQRFGRKIGFG
ncbi:MAG: hypothetical protein KKA81_11340, partial [Bacteroidetes bacterium]|nr:hypothetical protein [Bacteroidota bacterium]